MGESSQTELSTFLIVCAIIGVVLLAVGIVVFIMVYTKRALAQQNELHLLKVNHQEALLRYNVEAQEIERKRIATELHDGIGALLAATRLYVNKLTQQKEPPKFEQLHQETKSMIDDLILNVRTISKDLLPPSLEKFGLLASLEDLVHKITSVQDIDIKLLVTAEKRIDSQKELALYRISQELLHNTLKYAQATEVKLAITFTDQQLHYSYQDNGQGFDFEAQQAKGLGLKSIESRAIFLKGDLDIQTGLGKGVKVVLVCGI